MNAIDMQQQVEESETSEAKAMLDLHIVGKGQEV